MSDKKNRKTSKTQHPWKNRYFSFDNSATISHKVSWGSQTLPA